MIRSFTKLMFICLYTALAMGQSADIVVPDIPGIEVEAGPVIPIPLTESAQAFRFRDGLIVVGRKQTSMWSADGGYTWKRGPESPGEKTVIDLGEGQILSIGRNSKRRPDGKYTLYQSRSLDNWKSVTREQAVLDIPRASYTTTGSGGRVDGFLFHHGILQLDDGRLIGTMYGNYEGDTELCAGYPAELNQRKYRTVVVFSDDKGRTWGDPVLVAYKLMLGRGIPFDHAMVGKSIPESRASKTTIVPAITMEGFREADLVEAPNGDLVCLMRSGGRNPAPGVHLFPTPLYCSRSSDGGQSWSPPEQIADRGVCPSAVTMRNGIIVCTYSRPGNWLIFSDDNGRTWKGAFQFGPSGSTNYILETGPDTIQVFYEIEDERGTSVLGTYFTVKKK